MKMTIEAFCSQEEDEYVINARTEEEVVWILRKFDELGLRWNSGASYLDEANWDRYMEQTVYYPRGRYASVDYAEQCGLTVLTLDDILRPEDAALIEWDLLFK